MHGEPDATVTHTATTQPDLAVAVAVVATLVVTALAASLLAALRAARRLRRSADALEREVRGVLETVDGTLAQASAELERVDDLIGSAEQLTGAVGSASHMAYASLASPVIKLMAFSRGASRASRRLRAGGRRSSNASLSSKARR